METQKRLTKEEVDREISRLEQEQGLENTDIYNLKMEHLNTMRQMVIRGDREWERIHRIKQHLREQRNCKSFLTKS